MLGLGASSSGLLRSTPVGGVHTGFAEAAQLLLCLRTTTHARGLCCTERDRKRVFCFFRLIVFVRLSWLYKFLSIPLWSLFYCRVFFHRFGLFRPMFLGYFSWFSLLFFLQRFLRFVCQAKPTSPAANACGGADTHELRSSVHLYRGLPESAVGVR